MRVILLNTGRFALIQPIMNPSSHDDKAENESLHVFFRQILKGGAKCVPFVGGLLEEAIFGTLDQVSAATQSTRLFEALERIEARLDEKTEDVPDAFLRLLSEADMSEEAAGVLHAVVTNVTSTANGQDPSEQLLVALDRLLRRKNLSLTAVTNNPAQIAARVTQERGTWTLDEFGALYTHSSDTTDVLFVFVHGILANAITTWGDVVERIGAVTTEPFHAFCYSFPAWPWQRSNGVREAAEHLQAWFGLRKKQGHDYKHIAFITHSTGGLVAKDLVAASFQASLASLRAVPSPVAPIRAAESTAAMTRYGDLGIAVTKIRRVVNIATPHHGGQLALTITLLYPYFLLSLLCWPVLALIRIATLGACDWGPNRSAWQLCFRNRFLTRLRERFEETSNRIVELALPIPTCVEINGSSDIAVAFERGLVAPLRGTHFSLKKHAIHEALPIIRRYSRPKSDISVAMWTLERCVNLDLRQRVDELLGRPTVGDTPVAGSQRALADEILGRIRSPDVDVHCLVITGEAGVGKSTVLRAVARRLAATYLNDPEEGHPLPVFLPLQQIKLSDEVLRLLKDGNQTSARVLFDSFVAEWTAWAASLTSDSSIQPEWFWKCARFQTVALIYDGLDEFFINNPDSPPALFAQAIDYFRSECMRNRPTSVNAPTVVLAIRSSYPGHQYLASRLNDLHELEVLSLEQALLAFPDIAPILRELKNDPVIHILLKPLILARLGPRGARLSAVNLKTKRGIIREAMLAIVEESSLVASIAAAGHFATTQQCEIATWVLGWLFFEEGRASITISDVTGAVADLVSHWSDQTNDTPTELLDALRLLTHGEIVSLFLNRTVFVSIGQDRWRFVHREWEDYLAAMYIAECVWLKDTRDAGKLALTQPMFEMAGEQIVRLRKEHGEPDDSSDRWTSYVTAIVKAGGIAVVNFTGILGNSVLQLPVVALERLLSLPTVDDMNLAEKLLIFTVVTHRALRADATDDSAQDLRHLLLPIIAQYGAGAARPHRDAITASLAWCYHKALSLKFGDVDAPLHQWPGLGSDPEQEADALSVVTMGLENNCRVLPHHRSLQVAFLQIQDLVLRDPDRPISVAHYLYFLAVVRKHKAHIVEVAQVLPRIFRDDSRNALAFRNYAAVPEVASLFEKCRSINSGQ